MKHCNENPNENKDEVKCSYSEYEKNAGQDNLAEKRYENKTAEEIVAEGNKKSLHGKSKFEDQDQQDPKLLAEIDRNIQTSASVSLLQLALNGESKDMQERMLEDLYVLARIAILGQLTVIYGGANTGKTLLVFWLLSEAIKSGGIDPKNIFYINADDNHKGLIFKLQWAERYGFYMLAPGYKGFKPSQLRDYMNKLNQEDSARGKVLILDTVKKFTNLMDKTASSVFNECLRQFVLHGGTVIMLAHVNKHKGDDGKPIYAGTSDLVDDSDCAYTLEVVSHDKNTGKKVVKFENFKCRGDVAMEVVYQYDASESLSYEDRLKSIRLVDDAETKSIQKRQYLDCKLEKNRLAIEVIKEVVNEGTTQKTALLAEAHARSGISKSKLQKALQDHTGSNVDDYQYWHVNVADKNAHIYQLNWGVV